MEEGGGEDDKEEANGENLDIGKLECLLSRAVLLTKERAIMVFNPAAMAEAYMGTVATGIDRLVWEGLLGTQRPGKRGKCSPSWLERNQTQCQR